MIGCRKWGLALIGRELCYHWLQIMELCYDWLISMSFLGRHRHGHSRVAPAAPDEFLNSQLSLGFLNRESTSFSKTLKKYFLHLQNLMLMEPVF